MTLETMWRVARETFLDGEPADERQQKLHHQAERSEYDNGTAVAVPLDVLAAAVGAAPDEVLRTMDGTQHAEWQSCYQAVSELPEGLASTRTMVFLHTHKGP